MLWSKRLQLFSVKCHNFFNTLKFFLLQLEASSQSKHKMESGLLLNVVVGQCSSIF